MDITRNAEVKDGVVEVTTVCKYNGQELATLVGLTEFLRDLAGVTRVNGIEVFDQTAMLAMTMQRKQAFCDAADLIEKLVFGGDVSPRTGLPAESAASKEAASPNSEE